jgi:hypothetical protein
VGHRLRRSDRGRDRHRRHGLHLRAGPSGGQVTIDHEGQPLTFDLDCARPEVVCPAEAWPDTVSIDQKNDTYEHQMIVTIPKQTCSGSLVEPDPASCGDGTTNPDCKKVCDGDITVASADAFGVIGEAGDSCLLPRRRGRLERRQLR